MSHSISLVNDQFKNYGPPTIVENNYTRIAVQKIDWNAVILRSTFIEAF